MIWDIEEKFDNTSGPAGMVTAAEINALKAVVDAKHDDENLAAAVGFGSAPAFDALGTLYGIPVLPASYATAANIIAGTDTGALAWSAEANAAVGAPAVVNSAAGAITLDFGTGLVKKTVLTEGISAFAIQNLPEHASGLWEVKGHASSEFTLTFPSGGVWVVPAGSLAIPANNYVLVSFRRSGSLYLVSYTDLLTVKP